MTGMNAETEAPGALNLAERIRRLSNGRATLDVAQFQFIGMTEIRDGVNVHVEGPLTDFLAMAAPALPDLVVDAQQSKVALDLHIGGTLRAPQPTGRVSFTAASLRYGNEPPLTDVAIDAEVEPARIVFQSLAATAVGARVQGNGLVPLRLLVPERSNRQGATGIAAWGSNWFGSLPPEPESATVKARVTGLPTEALAPFVDPSTLQQISGSVDATLTADADGFTLDRVRSLLVLDRASLVAAGVPFEQSAPTRIRLANGRAQIEEFQFDATIKSIEDVKVGMHVPGLVTNITNFGAFVDIGVKQDGLVHVSQLANRFISDPNQVVKLNQKVMVTVTEVDVARKRIALSMKDASSAKKEEPRNTKGAPKPFSKKPEPQNAFHSKLMELKKKFND